MMRRKLRLLFALALLLIPIGLAGAQTSTNYVTQRAVIAGGGTAKSASYAVVAVIGQPVTNVVDSTKVAIQPPPPSLL